MGNMQSLPISLHPLHHVAHCLSIQTFLFAFMSVCLKEDDTGTLKITRHDDIEMEKPFEVAAEAHQDGIEGKG